MTRANIEENLKLLPDKPGVYIHKDQMGQIIYVGKAISLKRRVRQYFQSSKTMDLKVKAMVDHIADFEYIVCANEMEAFVLENNLIKENRPKYNILLKDDKTYPYLHVTLDEEWPRLVKTRIIGNDKGKYFGPYTDVAALNVMIELLNDVFCLKRCNTKRFNGKSRVCLNYHIGRCDGMCAGKGDKEDYMARVQSVLDFLAGRDGSLIKHLERCMLEASDKMDYEKAAKYRDFMKSAATLLEKQRVDFKKDVDIDVIVAVGSSHVALFAVREGKLAGRETFEIQAGEEDSKAVKVGEFIRQYYGDMVQGPSELLVEELPQDVKLLEQFLGQLWGKKVLIHKPLKGEKRELLRLAEHNRNEMLKTMENREERVKKKNRNISGEIKHIIDMCNGAKGVAADDLPKDYRVEAYDVSNTNGIDTVAAMVAFEGLRANKKAYRRFKIRTNLPGDDYGSMQEVLYRRIKRGLEGDPGFSAMPDLIIIDGGKGHLNAALQMLKALKVSIPTVGAVKDDSHRTRGLVYYDPLEDKVWEIDLKENPTLFSYVGTIQEEVHRFAIDYHRKLRDGDSISSILDEIPGIGKVKRNKLLQTFKNVENIKSANIEELVAVDGITEKNAKDIISFFGNSENKDIKN